jgi:hypothetical protein
MTRLLDDQPLRLGGDTPEIGAEVADRYEADRLRRAAPGFHLAGVALGYLAAGILYAAVVCVIAGALWGALKVGVLAWNALRSLT